MEIIKIALTGGPCGGKSGAEKFLREALLKLGWHMVFVPEVATRIIRQFGINPPELAREQHLAFQHFLFDEQVRQENFAVAEAQKIKGAGKIVVICDRGCPDSSVYMEPADFEQMISARKLTRLGIRDGRYSAVFHLVTAADGAEAHYNRDNSSRYETIKDARLADQKTRLAWLGHPHLRIIDNSTDFAGKMERLLEKIKLALGIPVPIENERKYKICLPFDLTTIPVPHQTVELEQVYLPGNEKIRIRWRRQENNGNVYYKTRKIATSVAGSNQELEEIISCKDYWRLYRERNENLAPIIKRRTHFLHANQSFELDEFITPEWWQGLQLLEIELDNMDDKVALPSWLGPVVDVTDLPAYSNYNIAQKPA